MDLARMFFGGWPSLARIVLVGVPVYAILLVLLHVGGKHSLARTNAYGLVITVSLGSALASAVLTREVTLADGALAIGLLLALQYLLSTWVSRWSWAAQVITQRAVLLARDGVLLEEAMRRERVTEPEVLAAIRKQGLGSLADVGAVVLECDGSFSVIRRPGPDPSVLADVRTALDDRDG